MYTIDGSSGTVERVAPDGTVRMLASIPLTGFGDGGQVTLSRAADGTLYAADGVSLVRIAATGDVQLLNTTDNIFQAVPVGPPLASTSPTVPPHGPAFAGPVPEPGSPGVHCSL